MPPLRQNDLSKPMLELCRIRPDLRLSNLGRRLLTLATPSTTLPLWIEALPMDLSDAHGKVLWSWHSALVFSRLPFSAFCRKSTRGIPLPRVRESFIGDMRPAGHPRSLLSTRQRPGKPTSKLPGTSECRNGRSGSTSLNITMESVQSDAAWEVQ